MNFLFEQFNSYYLVRILLSCFAGFLIGYERENRNKFAGVRTHILVALGACCAMLISKYGFCDSNNFDAARVSAQVISGIGFLGAGVIFVKNNAVSGLTTAAGIWTTSIIGMAFGSGLYIVGIISALLVVTFQLLLYRNEFIRLKSVLYSMEIGFDSPIFLNEMDKFINKSKIKTRGEDVIYKEESLVIELKYLSKNREEKNKFIEFLSSNRHVKYFTIK